MFKLNTASAAAQLGSSDSFFELGIGLYSSHSAMHFGQLAIYLKEGP